MKKKNLLIGLYLLVFFFLGVAEYQGDSAITMFAYYSIVYLNLGNAVRLANKQTQTEEAEL